MDKKETCEHKWVLVGQDWEDPILVNYYKCEKCGKTKTVPEYHGPLPPEEGA